MWTKLNLPIFLFNVGLFTLINIDSLMFLAKPCPSLPIIYVGPKLVSIISNTSMKKCQE